MPAGFCSIDFCRAPSKGFALNWSCGSLDVSAFCVHHGGRFVVSHEFFRAHEADIEGRLTQSLFISALVDFRTRVELEHQRDLDPAVIAARGGK